MKDVSILNEMIFSASTENELQEKFEDILRITVSTTRVNMMTRSQSNFCHFQD